MVEFELLAVSAIPLFVLGALLYSAYRTGSRLGTVVFGLTLFHEISLVIFPIWYSVFTNYNLEGELVIATRPEDLLAVMVGEAVFVCLFGMGWLMAGRLFRKVPKTAVDSATENRLVFLLLAMGLFVYLRQFLAPPPDFNTVSQHGEIQAAVDFLETLYGWLRGFVAFPSVIVACLVVVNRRNYPRLFAGIAVVLLILLALGGLSEGVRGRIIWIISLLGAIAVLMKKRNMIIVGLVLLVVFLPFSEYLAGRFRSIYFTDLTGGSRLDSLAYFFSAAFSGEAEVSTSDSFLHTFARRAQGPRNSTVLYKLYDRGREAGFTPITSALLTPIPRAIWPEKGVAGSIDNTNYGAAVYLVRSVGYNAPIYNMGPILASAEAYWEGGWIWLCFSGILMGLFWRLIVQRWSDISRTIGLIVVFTFAAALLIDGLLTTLQPMYALINIIWTAVLPLVLFNKLVVSMTHRRTRTVPAARILRQGAQLD